MKQFLYYLVFLVVAPLTAQHIQKIEPPVWWVGMQNTDLELMIYGNDIASFSPSINSKKITVTGITRTENSNYLFLKIDLKNAKAGSFDIKFKKKGSKSFSFEYVLKARDLTQKHLGFDSSDAIYLITPDRFSNGDTGNDVLETLLEKKIDRSNDYARHGGDIKGISQRLDYISDLGFTAIWPSPLLTNDMKESSYHGYAMTDFYEVDPRFGTLSEYIDLSKKMADKGMKLIMDQVANHIGLAHWWMKDLPAIDWVNYQEEFLNGITVITNHKRTVNQDLYASSKDKALHSQGWFVDTMPDLNQKNPLLATYLIQNSIWWVETLNLGGIRQDTYPYPDKNFMSDWAKAIMTEYPAFSIVGEEWSTNPLLVGYWQQGANNKDGYESHLTSTMDFPMQKAVIDGLNEEETWGTGLVKLYEGLANDFSYANPSKMMIFSDNHDMGRVFTQLKEDIPTHKMALGYMLALPRIPQVYYGTEILMENTEKPNDHGLIRTDFPGGWDGDTVNAFTGLGLNDAQLDMQLFTKKIVNYRKSSKAIHTGKTIHFSPKNNVYVLARILDDEIVVIILNKNKASFSLNLNRFEELGLANRKIKNVVSGGIITWDEVLELSKRGFYMFTTKL
ncbi:MAG: glycoside hydrolase family 13 protein [Flavobacteriaceae bacterium]|nr:glycoside hydrolase family 13 protein [Flavobacteriaceae bacterium]